jgi:ribosomal protein S18 acetylase RimI-like enzyme
MVKAKYEDKTIIVNILASAFKENQSVNFIVRQDKFLSRRINALMKYSFEVCYRFGEVWLSDDRKACALTLSPHLKHTSLTSIWLDIKLIFRAIRINGIAKTVKREARIKKIQPDEEMVYLWFIGVAPLYQHRGIGSNLLKEIIAGADEKKLMVCLETSTLKNLPWYERFGFEIYNQLELGYTLFFLKRKPKN